MPHNSIVLIDYSPHTSLISADFSTYSRDWIKNYIEAKIGSRLLPNNKGLMFSEAAKVEGKDCKSIYKSLNANGNDKIVYVYNVQESVVRELRKSIIRSSPAVERRGAEKLLQQLDKHRYEVRVDCGSEAKSTVVNYKNTNHNEIMHGLLIGAIVITIVAAIGLLARGKWIRE